MVPQPIGYPLLIPLVRLIDLIPGNQFFWNVTLLAALPSSIAVVLVYLTVRKHGERFGLAAALVLLGSAIFLMEATIGKLEYSLTACFIAAAIWAQSSNRGYLCFAFLGLATAVHVMAGIVSVIVLVVQWFRKEPWLKQAGVWFATGIIPYSLILALMALPTPRFMAGHLNWYYVKIYFLGIGNNLAGAIALDDLPLRLLTFVVLMVVSLGLSWRVIIKGWGTPLLVASVLFPVWYYITCFDPGTWPYLAVIMPPLAVMAGVGLSRLEKKDLRIVVTGALALILLNGLVFNAETLRKAEPYATDFIDDLNEVPDGSVIVSLSGAFSFSTFYWSLESGRELISVRFKSVELGFRDYGEYLGKKYGLQGTNVKELTASALDSGRSVYLAYVPSDLKATRNPTEEVKCFTTEPVEGSRFLHKVTGLTSYQPSYFPSATSGQ